MGRAPGQNGAFRYNHTSPSAIETARNNYPPKHSESNTGHSPVPHLLSTYPHRRILAPHRIPPTAPNIAAPTPTVPLKAVAPTTRQRGWRFQGGHPLGGGPGAKSPGGSGAAPRRRVSRPTQQIFAPHRIPATARSGAAANAAVPFQAVVSTTRQREWRFQGGHPLGGGPGARSPGGGPGQRPRRRVSRPTQQILRSTRIPHPRYPFPP